MTPIGPAVREKMRHLTTAELALELTARLREAAAPAGGGTSLSKGVVRQLGVLAAAAGPRLDRPPNRFSIRKAMGPISRVLEHPLVHWESFQGLRVLELGSGGLNPFAPLVPFLAAGADSALGVDVEEIEDPPAAARAVYEVICALVLGATWPRIPVPGAVLLERLAGLDLARLAAGDTDALRGIPVGFRSSPVEDTRLPDASFDLLTSSSFLEHVPDPKQTVDECARLLRPGGLAVHSIDGVDHRWHYNPRQPPLDFLREDGDLPVVAGCNRMRPLEFVTLFEAAGFELCAVHESQVLELDDATIAGFAPRFRALPRRQLEVAGATFHLRRR